MEEGCGVWRGRGTPDLHVHTPRGSLNRILFGFYGGLLHHISMIDEIMAIGSTSSPLSILEVGVTEVQVPALRSQGWSPW